MTHVQEDRNHCFSNRYADRILRKLRTGIPSKTRPNRVLIRTGDPHLDKLARTVFESH